MPSALLLGTILCCPWRKGLPCSLPGWHWELVPPQIQGWTYDLGPADLHFPWLWSFLFMDRHWLKSILWRVTPGHSQEMLKNWFETRVTKLIGCRAPFESSIAIQQTIPKLSGLRDQPYHYLSQFGDLPGIKGEVLLHLWWWLGCSLPGILLGWNIQDGNWCWLLARSSTGSVEWRVSVIFHVAASCGPGFTEWWTSSKSKCSKRRSPGGQVSITSLLVISWSAYRQDRTVCNFWDWFFPTHIRISRFTQVHCVLPIVCSFLLSSSIPCMDVP